MKPFTKAASAVFALVAVVQLLRVLLGWQVQVAQYLVPPWFSVLACLLAATFAVMLWRENRA